MYRNNTLCFLHLEITRLPVTRWVTNTINDQFKCFCLKWLNFLGQNGSMFSLSALRENWIIFHIKSWVTDVAEIRHNFIGQNDSVFLFSVLREKKLSHFDLKSRVTVGTKIVIIFSGQNYSILSPRALKEKIESFWFEKLSHLGTKIWPNFLNQNYSIFISVLQEKKIELFNLINFDLKDESPVELKFHPTL